MLSKLTRLSLQLYMLLAFFFIFAPIIVNIIFSFDANRFSSLPLGGFTTRWYDELLSDQQAGLAFWRSLVVSLSVGTLSTVLGFTAAYTDYRYRFFGKSFYLLLALLPPTIPVAILGVAMLIFLSHVGLFGYLHSIIITHVVYAIPFSMGLNRLRLSQMDQNLEAAAWNLGATPWRSLTLIVIPFCRPALLSSFFLTMAVSFDEYAMAWFVGGFNETVPVRILTQLQREMSPLVNAIGGIVFCISLTLVLLASLMFKKQADTGGQK